MIFNVLNLPLEYICKVDRIGSLDQGPENRARYLMLELTDKESRIKVKEASKKLNNIAELKHLRMKADLPKRAREEYSRLFKLKETLEKDNPGQEIKYENGKIMVDNEIVDQFKSSSQIF